FRPGHPPLRIPWNEIQFSRTQRFFRDYVVLTLGASEQIPLRISTGLAGRLGLLYGPPPGAAISSSPPLPPPIQ
ncbi:MAG TPA: hypothetical protein VGR64_07155, partial [Terracidiphilus sp.]|nr:hypothetical protein [Terracidiphilus sp.]